MIFQPHRFSGCIVARRKLQPSLSQNPPNKTSFSLGKCRPGESSISTYNISVFWEIGNTGHRKAVQVLVAKLVPVSEIDKAGY